MALSAPEIQFASGTPDLLVMELSGLPERRARGIALDSVFRARQLMPRVTGATASRLQPFYEDGWVGIWFPDAHTWFMEQGTRPRTMRSLAGKTIPMWITDTDGSERAKNPKARVRQTDDGRTQILIFRKAAPIGARKRVVSKWGNPYLAPASYPGAPGRIASRVAGGGIAQGNVGVRWRHPGIRAVGFLNTAISTAVFDAGLILGTLYAVDNASWQLVRAGRRRRL